MEIYVVQKGDTVASVAQRFGISAAKLINDNGLTMPYTLVTGQTLVITMPTQTYTVIEGDTLQNIAAAFHITVMQLFRNNPDLSNREYLQPGETLNISFANNKGRIYTNGFAYPFIKEDVLRRTLPYLTYLTLFNYRISSSGDITENYDDTEVIQSAKNFSVIPIMLLSTLSILGDENPEVAYSLLLNTDIQDRFIENVLNKLRVKGYSGIDLTFLYINKSSLSLYNDFLTRVSDRLNPAGYTVFVTINPNLYLTDHEISFERVDYTTIAQVANNVTFLSYDWGYSIGPPTPVSVIAARPFIDFAVTQVPLEKLELGMPTLGYDWQLPYVAGFTRASALNFDSAVTLAGQVDAVIRYDESTLSAFYQYSVGSTDPQIQHIVWFKDARSIDSAMRILMEYRIPGTGIWNVMYYFTQMWLVINTQYEIGKLLPEV